MELYNKIIEKVEGHLGAEAPTKRYKYDPNKTWEDVGGNQLIMMKESAYELGGDGKPAVNYACVTSDDFVSEDEILVYGRDLSEINGSVPFARIAIVKVRDLDGEGEENTEPLFRAIQDIDFVKYHVYPKGYMIRSSTDSFREQVRVSKDAVKKGISFERIGNSYIAQYKKNPNILAVKLIFVTAEGADFAGMRADAKKTRDITMTLSKILEGMSTDCHTCGLREICDEVEGLKELHFGKGKKEFQGK